MNKNNVDYLVKDRIEYLQYLELKEKNKNDDKIVEYLIKNHYDFNDRALKFKLSDERIFIIRIDLNIIRSLEPIF